MRTPMLLLCCVLLTFLYPLRAQEASLKDAVLANERKFSELQIQRKCDAAAELLADDFRGISAGIGPKSDFLSGCKAGQVITTSEKFSNIEFELLTPGSAMVTYRDDAAFIVDGKVTQLQAFGSSVWVKHGTKWLLHLHTATPIPFVITEEGKLRLLYPADGEEHDKSAAQKEIENQIIALEERGWEAVKNKQYTTLASLDSEDYQEIDADGLRTKAQSLQNSKDLVITDYAMTDVSVRPLAKDVALLTYKMTIKGTFKGQLMPTKPYYYGTVYVNKHGKWLVTFSEETLLQ